MSELSINDLPPEIMTKVFKYLNYKNLKNATLTCKLWNELIESECRWSVRLDATIDTPVSQQKINFLLMTNRKFGRIQVENVRLTDDGIFNMFRRHGSNVQFMECVDVVDSLDSFADILNFTSNLKHLIVRQENPTIVTHDLSSHKFLPELKKLKTLQILVSDHRIIKCFHKARPTTIIVLENCVELGRHCGPLEDFLLSQDKLMTLDVDNRSSERTTLIELGKLNVPIPFRLTRLEISLGGVADSNHKQEAILSILKSQAKSLTELKLGDGIPSLGYKCIFSCMTNLTSLSVTINGIPRHNEFYDQVPQNNSIRTLEVVDIRGYGAPECLARLIEKLPNICSLIFIGYLDRALEAVHSISKLESLSIGEVYEPTINLMNFSNLKALRIQSLFCKINWSEFSMKHTRLTELTINGMHRPCYLTSDDIDQITNNVDLQSLQLGAGFMADDRFFEIIRAKCTNLKVLDLDRSCVLPHGCNVKVNVLRLYDNINFPK